MTHRAADDGAELNWERDRLRWISITGVSPLFHFWFDADAPAGHLWPPPGDEGRRRGKIR